jgi:predicted O-linked N-acetylglucosamine transferase (SPINDLY family)
MNLFLSQGREMIASILEFVYDHDVTDEWILVLLSSRFNKDIQMICLYYLFTPSLFYRDEGHIDDTYQRIHDSLTNVSSISLLPLRLDESNLYHPINISYFYSYMGRDTSRLLTLYSALMYQLFPCLAFSMERKITTKKRIGLFSSFLFLNHSVARDRLGIVKHLCKTFEVYLFTTDESQPREFYNWVMEDVKPHSIQHVTANTIHEIMKDASLDILIYPELGMCPQTYLYAHMRFAPIQVTTWGHSETSGIPTIDYYISSDYFQSNDRFSETVVHFPSLGTYYYPMDYLCLQEETVESARRQYELGDFIYYGILQNMNKCHPVMIDFMKRVCDGDPRARFVMTVSEPHTMKLHLEQVFSYPDRVILFPNLPNDFYFTLLRAIDLLIDTYPFGGCNTTLDACYVGKMVMTLPSPFLRGRFTYGFYKKMEMIEPICISMEEWVKKSIFYANHSEERSLIEQKIKERSYVLFREKNSRVDWEEWINGL